jgi:hypothetical protein
MEKENNSPSNAKSKWWIWLIVAILVLCLALVCCGLVAIGVYYLWPDSNAGVVEPQIIPNIPTAFPAPTVPGVLPVPTLPGVLPVQTLSAIELDENAQPRYGSISLQRGFSPDPYAMGIEVGGMAYASANNLPCGFTTPEPTFAFSLSGGASATFLRIFFSASEEGDPTMVLLTPDQEWICADDFTYGLNPVIDFDAAASGNYVIWVGTWSPSTTIHGNLFITGSETVTP